MKQYLTILCATHLLIPTLCSAMENKSDYKTLECIKKPRHINYLKNNRVIVNGFNGCSIINPITDTEIIKVCNNYSTHLAVHQNKNHFALSYNTTVTVYTYDDKIEKVGKIWSSNEFPENDVISSSIFNPSDMTIITRRKRFPGYIKHNYINNQTLFWNNALENAKNPPKIAFHPTKPRICLAHHNGCISIHTQNTMELLNTFNLKHYHNFCEYNSNGSIIVCGNKVSINILYPHTRKSCRIPNTTKKSYHCIALHPNGSSLATLSSPNNIVHYWDMKTRKLIDEFSSLSRNIQIGDKGLAFSLCGTELMIALSENCITIPVPFNVIYSPRTRKKLHYILFLLNNYKIDVRNTLPYDLIQMFMHNLLEAYRC